MSRKTLKLPEEEYDRHNEQRKEMGLSWAEYIDGQAPDMEETIRGVIRDEMDHGECDVIECDDDAEVQAIIRNPGDDRLLSQRFCYDHKQEWSGYIVESERISG
jgi:hypothetical protein